MRIIIAALLSLVATGALACQGIECRPSTTTHQGTSAGSTGSAFGSALSHSISSTNGPGYSANSGKASTNVQVHGYAKRNTYVRDKHEGYQPNGYKAGVGVDIITRTEGHSDNYGSGLGMTVNVADGFGSGVVNGSADSHTHPAKLCRVYRYVWRYNPQTRQRYRVKVYVGTFKKTYYHARLAEASGSGSVVASAWSETIAEDVDPRRNHGQEDGATRSESRGHVRLAGYANTGYGRNGIYNNADSGALVTTDTEVRTRGDTLYNGGYAEALSNAEVFANGRSGRVTAPPPVPGSVWTN